MLLSDRSFERAVYTSQICISLVFVVASVLALQADLDGPLQIAAFVIVAVGTALNLYELFVAEQCLEHSSRAFRWVLRQSKYKRRGAAWIWTRISDGPRCQGRDRRRDSDGFGRYGGICDLQPRRNYGQPGVDPGCNLNAGSPRADAARRPWWGSYVCLWLSRSLPLF